MANFKTHLSVAAAGSGLLATVFLGAGMVEPKEVVLLSVLGSIGGILPDIDLDHSSPTKIMFTSLGAIFAFLVMFNRADVYSIIELWLVWGLSYAIVRYLAWRVFSDFTGHRGIFHSIAAALFFWFFTVALCYHLFDFTHLFSWVAGFFVFLGFLIHLVLDEIYSVDFMNKRLKRSFGSALKLADANNLQASALMGGAALLFFFMAPSADAFLELLGSGQTYENILNRFFPEATWFAI
ncbi:MAG: hydrolase [Gammaproteobacteria bacterium]|nr:hydrolase [Gammaproteobacteria bacterium]